MTNLSRPGLSWTKSSYSGGNNNCLEVAHGATHTMPVRDSKRPTGPTLTISGAAWTTFIDSVKTTELG